jgi:predicted Zn-dependent peptidase
MPVASLASARSRAGAARRAPGAGEAEVIVLPSGVRLVLLPMPGFRSAAVSVYAGSGSAHEKRAENGVHHVVEHMAFKGTSTRSAREINVQAELLGADVNAHTDKDHTAFHMRGLAEDAPAFVAMLADIVLAPVFPADELERERQVLLQEFADIEDDPMATAYRLMDRASFGLHPAAWPVAGTRRAIESLARASLVACAARGFTAPNLVLGVAGGFDADAVHRAAERAFAAAPAGAPLTLDAPAWQGGTATRHLPHGQQAHLVIGWPAPRLAEDEGVAAMAAAVLGEGMSSPLLDELRERRGLAYQIAAAADVLAVSGQLVIECSTARDRVFEALGALLAQMRSMAARVPAAEHARARRQLQVRLATDAERPARRLEDAALELLALGRARSDEERAQRLADATPARVAAWLEERLAHPPALALVGDLPRGAGALADRQLAGAHR